MEISAVKGVYCNGKIKPLETIPIKEKKEVIIIFLDTLIKNDRIWDNSVAKDFLRGYSKKDMAYDRL